MSSARIGLDLLNAATVYEAENKDQKELAHLEAMWAGEQKIQVLISSEKDLDLLEPTIGRYVRQLKEENEDCVVISETVTVTQTEPEPLCIGPQSHPAFGSKQGQELRLSFETIMKDVEMKYMLGRVLTAIKKKAESGTKRAGRTRDEEATNKNATDEQNPSQVPEVEQLVPEAAGVRSLKLCTRFKVLDYVLALLLRALGAWEQRAAKYMISQKSFKRRDRSSSVTFPPFKEPVLDFAKGFLEDDLTSLVRESSQRGVNGDLLQEVREAFETYGHSPICLINTVYSLCERIVPEERPNNFDYLEEEYFRKMSITTSAEEIRRVTQMGIGICASFAQAQFAKFMEEHFEEVQKVLLSPHRCEGISLAALSKKLSDEEADEPHPPTDTRSIFPDEDRIPFMCKDTDLEIGGPCEVTLLNTKI